MADLKGKPERKPPECQGEVEGSCPYMKSVYEGWEYERFSCKQCGAGYTLYDDEMR